MKKLNKLQINAERLMRNEELLKIKGGEYENACTCTCFNMFNDEAYGYLVTPDGDCNAECGYAFDDATGFC